MPRRAVLISLNESDRLELERWVSAHRTPQQVAQRCRIVLAAAKGERDKDIAERMKINFKTILYCLPVVTNFFGFLFVINVYLKIYDANINQII